MISNNLHAFLDMIAVSEGTYGKGQNGYNVLVGGSLFDSYKDHPRTKVYIPRLGISSTAAGRYQILARYYDAYKKLLGLTDFTPRSQDAIAIQMIKEQTALPDVEAGHIAKAIDDCKNIWASLPGAGYGQREQKIERLIIAYKSCGGSVSA